MHKQILIAMVLLGAASAGMFVAAKHALHNPESVLARCATAVYHLADPWFAPHGENKHACLKREKVAEGCPAQRWHGVNLGPIEPIVVESDEEQPSAPHPRLSPEIAAAIERLRSQEENETPKAFDGVVLALRMPYADEGPEELPFPAEANGDVDCDLPGVYGFFVPPWQALLERLADSLRMSGN